MTVEQLREMAMEAVKRRPGNLWLRLGHNQKISCMIWMASEICERQDQIIAKLNVLLKRIPSDEIE